MFRELPCKEILCLEKVSKTSQLLGIKDSDSLPVWVHVSVATLYTFTNCCVSVRVRHIDNIL